VTAGARAEVLKRCSREMPQTHRPDGRTRDSRAEKARGTQTSLDMVGRREGVRGGERRWALLPHWLLLRPLCRRPPTLGLARLLFWLPLAPEPCARGGRRGRGKPRGRGQQRGLTGSTRGSAAAGTLPSALFPLRAVCFEEADPISAADILLPSPVRRCRAPC